MSRFKIIECCKQSPLLFKEYMFSSWKVTLKRLERSGSPSRRHEAVKKERFKDLTDLEGSFIAKQILQGGEVLFPSFYLELTLTY